MFTMLLFLSVALAFSIISVIAGAEKDRVASLIVLPPIVLGYDELYDEPGTSKPVETPKPEQLLRTGKKEVPAPKKKLDLPWDQLVAYEDPLGQDSVIIPQQRLTLERTGHGRLRVQNSIRNILGQKFIDIEDRRNGHKHDWKHFKREGNNNSALNATQENIKETSTKKEDAIITESSSITSSAATNVESILTEPIADDDNENREMDATEDHFSLPAKGKLSDPLNGDALNFQGKFVLPDKLFDCPCSKKKS